MVLFADRYELLDSLGSGGSGTVYRARDQVLSTDVALKVLASGEDTLAVREASALRALESDHVLPVLNAGVHNDVPFVVTEIAANGSVEGKLTANGCGLDVGMTIRWIRQMLIGLEYCHRRRILHRDVTSNNVFLDSDDHARIGDFGTATNIDDDGTAARHGNQHVVAPEGYETGRLSVRSEVFSVGATTWRMLTGEWPYEAPTEEELAEKMAAGARRRLRDVAPHVSRSVAGVVEKALDPDPNSRYASAADLREAFSECRLTDRRWGPISAHDGHHSCWIGESPTGTINACLTIRANSAEVVTTRSSNGRRISNGCFTATQASLGPALRRLFDNL
jgi:serine/threonine-protein kinase